MPASPAATNLTAIVDRTAGLRTVVARLLEDRIAAGHAADPGPLLGILDAAAADLEALLAVYGISVPAPGPRRTLPAPETHIQHEVWMPTRIGGPIDRQDVVRADYATAHADGQLLAATYPAATIVLRSVQVTRVVTAERTLGPAPQHTTPTHSR